MAEVHPEISKIWP